MLRFLYSFDYDASGGATDIASPMVFNVKVYSIADKYGIPALKLLACKKFQESVKACWNMDEFSRAISEVYSSNPPNDRRLRGILVNVVCEHITELLQKQDFRDTLGETVGFASDLEQFQANQKPSGEQTEINYGCPCCSREWKVSEDENEDLDCSYYCPYCRFQAYDWTRYILQ